MALLILTLPTAFAGTPVPEDFLTRYDTIRVALVADKLDDAEVAARGLATATAADPTLADPATRLGAAPDAKTARIAFGDLSRALVLELASGGPKVWVYHCPMWSSGFAWWVQPKAGIANPYMGTSMPECGEEMSLKAAAKAAAG